MIPSPPEQRTRFTVAYQVLADAIAAHAFPGCAFGVLAGGRIVLLDALGQFTYHREARAVTAETAFDVASLTKVVATTSMAMLLSQRGLLNVDTLLADLLPAFVAARSANDLARSVSLRHLLAHNSGLPGYVEFFRAARTAQELMCACLSLPLEATPGSRAEYSDPGFILLGKALEALARESIDSWTQSEVFAPLGMTATGFCPPAEIHPFIPPTEECTTLRMRRIQGEVQDENAWLLNGVAGHAGLFSNVPDLLAFAQAILSARTKPDMGQAIPRLFAGATVAAYAQRQSPTGSSRALGWDTPSENSSSGRRFSRNSIGHLGYSGCSFWIDLDAEIAVVLLTNRTWPDRKCQLIRKVRPAFHDAIRMAIEGE